MENKLHQTSRDTMLLRMLNICGEFGSYSDACSTIIMTHFNAIYNHLQDNFNADNVCHLSGQCSGRYHKHEDDTDAVSILIILRDKRKYMYRIFIKIHTIYNI